MFRNLIESSFADVFSATSQPIRVAPSKDELEVIRAKKEEERRAAEQLRLEQEAAANPKGKKAAPKKGADPSPPPPPPVEEDPLVEYKDCVPRTSFVLTASNYAKTRESLLAEGHSRVEGLQGPQDGADAFDGALDLDQIIQDHLKFLRDEVGYVEPMEITKFNDQTVVPENPVPQQNRLEEHEPFESAAMKPMMMGSALNEINAKSAQQRVLAPPAADEEDETVEAASPQPPSKPPNRSLKATRPNTLRKAAAAASVRSSSLASSTFGRAPTEEDVSKMFVVTPPEVVFRNWSVGKMYEETVTIMNTDSSSRRLRIRPPTHPNFSVTLQSDHNPNNAIAPGVALKYAVRFTPQTSELHESELSVGTTREVQGSSATANANAVWATFGITVRGERPPPVALFSSPVELAPILPGTTTSVTHLLRNAGGDGTFTFECQRGELAPVVVEPSEVVLRSGQEVPVRITLSTDRPGTYNRTVAIRLNFGGATTYHEFTGECVTPNVALTLLNGREVSHGGSVTTVHFPPTVVNSMPQKTFEVTNHGRIPIPYAWRSTCDAFEVSPTAGVLLPGAVMVFDVRYVARVVGEHQGRARLNYLNLVLVELDLMAEAVPMEGIVVPTHINTVVPVLIQLTNEREITLYNPNSRSVQWAVDPLDGDLHPGRGPGQRSGSHDLSKDPKVLMNQRSQQRGVRFESSPSNGVIQAHSFEVVTLMFSLLQAHAQGQIEVWMEGLDESQFITYDLHARGPCVQVVPSSIDFGVVPYGGEAEARITIQNTNDIPVTYTLQSARDMVMAADSDEPVDDDRKWYMFLPEQGTLRPWGSAIATVYLRGVTPGPVQDVVEVALDNVGISKFLDVCADVHMPQVVFAESVLSIATLYHGVPFVAEVKMQNLSSVDVRYQWMVPSLPDVGITFYPPQGVVAAGAKDHRTRVEVTVTYDHRPGKLLDLCAAVAVDDGADTLVPLNIVCDDVRCMSVSVEHDVDEDAVEGMAPERFMQILLGNLISGVTRSPISPYIDDIDLGDLLLEHGEPFTRRTFVLTLRNHSECVGEFDVRVHKYSTTTTSRVKNRTRRQLTLEDTPPAGFMSQLLNGATKVVEDGLQLRMRAEEALVQGRGVGIEICGSTLNGTLRSLEQINFEVAVHCNLPLTFKDTLVFRCEHLPVMRLPITMRCKMQPLVVEGNVVGLVLPDDEHNGMPEMRIAPQVFNTGIATVKTLRIVNRTPRDLNVTAQLFPERYALHGTLDVDDEPTVGARGHPIRFNFGFEEPTHRPTSFKVHPANFTLKALQCRTVTLEYNPVEPGEHSCCVKFVSKIIQNESATSYLLEEFYMENTPLGEVKVTHADPEVAKDGLKINRLTFRRPHVTSSALKDNVDPYSSPAHHHHSDDAASSEDEGMGTSRDAEEEAFMQRVRDAKLRQDRLNDERERCNAFVARRWKEIERDEAELSIPLEIDVHAEAIAPRLTSDPEKVLNLPKCLGGSPPYDMASFRREISFTNNEQFALQFCADVTAPFAITSSSHGNYVDITLRPGESVTYVVSLPWTLGLQSQYEPRQLSQTADGIEINGELTVSFTNGCTQGLPIRAVVHMPRVCVEPAVLHFPHPSTTRKHVSVLNYGAVPATYSVSASHGSWVVPGYRLVDGDGQTGVVAAASTMGVPGVANVEIELIPQDPLSTVTPDKTTTFAVSVDHGRSVTVEVTRMY
eukprot:PhM_4_TR15633/c0_g1_i2/m.78211